MTCCGYLYPRLKNENARQVQYIRIINISKDLIYTWSQVTNNVGSASFTLSPVGSLCKMGSS